MASVWAVVSGEYSDYGVTCICPDEQTANDVASRMNASQGSRFHRYEVEEFTYVTNVHDVFDYTVWNCQINFDTVEIVHEWAYSAQSLNGAPDPTNETAGDNTHVAGERPRMVWARSTRGPEHARKAALDERDKLMELHKWTEV